MPESESLQASDAPNNESIDDLSAQLETIDQQGVKGKKTAEAIGEINKRYQESGKSSPALEAQLRSVIGVTRGQLDAAESSQRKLQDQFNTLEEKFDITEEVQAETARTHIQNIVKANFTEEGPSPYFQGRIEKYVPLAQSFASQEIAVPTEQKIASQAKVQCLLEQWNAQRAGDWPESLEERYTLVDTLDLIEEEFDTRTLETFANAEATESFNVRAKRAQTLLPRFIQDNPQWAATHSEEFNASALEEQLGTLTANGTPTDYASQKRYMDIVDDIEYSIGLKARDEKFRTADLQNQFGKDVQAEFDKYVEYKSKYGTDENKQNYSDYMNDPSEGTEVFPYGDTDGKGLFQIYKDNVENNRWPDDPLKQARLAQVYHSIKHVNQQYLNAVGPVKDDPETSKNQVASESVDQDPEATSDSEESGEAENSESVVALTEEMPAESTIQDTGEPVEEEPKEATQTEPEPPESTEEPEVIPEISTTEQSAADTDTEPVLAEPKIANPVEQPKNAESKADRRVNNEKEANNVPDEFETVEAREAFGAKVQAEFDRYNSLYTKYKDVAAKTPDQQTPWQRYNNLLYRDASPLMQEHADTGLFTLWIDNLDDGNWPDVVEKQQKLASVYPQIVAARNMLIAECENSTNAEASPAIIQSTSEPQLERGHSTVATANPAEARAQRETLPDTDDFTEAFDYFKHTIKTDKTIYGGSVEYKAHASAVESAFNNLLIDNGNLNSPDVQDWIPRLNKKWRSRNNADAVAHASQFMEAVDAYKEQRSSLKEVAPYVRYEPVNMIDANNLEDAVQQLKESAPDIQDSLQKRFKEVETVYSEALERAGNNTELTQLVVQQWNNARERFSVGTDKKPAELFGGLTSSLQSLKSLTSAVTKYTPSMNAVELRQNLYEDAQTQEFVPMNAEELEAVIMLLRHADDILGSDGRYGSNDSFHNGSVDIVQTYLPVLQKYAKRTRSSSLNAVERMTGKNIDIGMSGTINKETLQWMLDAQSSPEPYTGIPDGMIIDISPT